MNPEQQAAGRRMARILALSGAVTIVIAIVLGAMVTPALYAVAILALIDFALAAGYSSGKLKINVPGAQAGAPPQDPTADPSYNPYARED